MLATLCQQHRVSMNVAEHSPCGQPCFLLNDGPIRFKRG
jgi:hypothetical protein